MKSYWALCTFMIKIYTSKKNHILTRLCNKWDLKVEFQLMHNLALVLSSICHEFSTLFKDAKKKETSYNHGVDKSGKSKVKEK